MPDYFKRRDVGAVTTFTPADAFFEFGFPATEQLVNNPSGQLLEVSFDGTNVHARLEPGTPSSAIRWPDHYRDKLWVRCPAGVGPSYVEVYASTR